MSATLDTTPQSLKGLKPTHCQIPASFLCLGAGYVCRQARYQMQVTRQPGRAAGCDSLGVAGSVCHLCACLYHECSALTPKP